MSLTKQQQLDTIKEFSENFALTGLSLSVIAKDLNTTPTAVKNDLELSPRSM